MQSVQQIDRPTLSKKRIEAIKELRTNILVSGDDKKVILLTGANFIRNPENTGLMLARALASLGKKTIFIDCDFEKSRLIKQFQSDEKVYGLTHFLAGIQALDKVICKTDRKNLYMMFPGVNPPNGTELLSTGRFASMIRVLRGVFDYIVVMAPQTGKGMDCELVAHSCDGAVLMMNAGKVKGVDARHLVTKLETAGCPVLGVALDLNENLEVK